MAGITSAITAPILVLISIPLAAFAILTTTLTFWVLLLRVLVVYFELAVALVGAYLLPNQPVSKHAMADPPKTPISDSNGSGHKRQPSFSSSNGSDPTRRATLKSESFVSLIGSNTNRDFEGVGGWRVAGNVEEEALWMSMNGRLELPAAPMRRHKRNSTGGSLGMISAGSGYGSPDVIRTPSYVVAPRRKSLSGTASPEGYFSMPFRGSMTALTGASDRPGRTSSGIRRKSSSSNSTISIGSADTVTTRKREG